MPFQSINLYSVHGTFCTGPVSSWVNKLWIVFCDMWSEGLKDRNNVNRDTGHLSTQKLVNSSSFWKVSVELRHLMMPLSLDYGNYQMQYYVKMTSHEVVYNHVNVNLTHPCVLVKSSSNITMLIIQFKFLNKTNIYCLILL